MRSTVLMALVALSSTLLANAQDKKELDKKAIRDMCGCYEVKFNFAETFEYSEDPAYVPSEVKRTGGLEWVELLENSEEKIVMQHLLIVGPEQHPHIVKHWRQDWLYENTDLYTYDHDNRWTYTALDPAQVKGQWTQKVYQVDDSPRYEGSASWVHVDGRSYWESTAAAPLPRREYTQRSDYNVTIRTNRHEITKNGWIHEQDNGKVIRENGKEDVLLAREKGYNTYTKVDESKCKAARDYWVSNAEKWAKVRTKWEEVFARQQDLVLKEKVENKVLFKYLLDDENYASEQAINSIIDSFVTE